MDVNTQELLDTLDDRLDDLTETLEPLLKHSVQDTASTLTVSDKARLYVLTTYAIESLLFSYFRLNGIQTKGHPVMTELQRTQQYVGKIKNAQQPAQRDMNLDKEAAGRFIKAALAGNEKYDEERAATQAKERANAGKKLEELQKKIDVARAEAKAVEEQRKAKEVEREKVVVIDDDEEEDEREVAPEVMPEESSGKKRKRRGAEGDSEKAESKEEKKLRKKAKRKERRQKEAEENDHYNNGDKKSRKIKK